MDKARRNALADELKTFLDCDISVFEEYSETEDNFDTLDVIVGIICKEDGTDTARSALDMIGATEDEINTLIADNFGFFF